MAWDWVRPLLFTGALFAFLGGGVTGYLSDFQIRFLLWIFLSFIVTVPFIKPWILKKRKNFIRELKIFSGAVMGLCSGLSGLGGSAILSPLLHESEALPFQKIAPSVSVVTWILVVLAVSGQQWQGVSIWNQDLFRQTFPVLLVFAFTGLTSGHFLHKSNDKRRRLLMIRILTAALFLKVSLELL